MEVDKISIARIERDRKLSYIKALKMINGANSEYYKKKKGSNIHIQSKSFDIKFRCLFEIT